MLRGDHINHNRHGEGKLSELSVGNSKTKGVSFQTTRASKPLAEMIRRDVRRTAAPQERFAYLKQRQGAESPRQSLCAGAANGEVAKIKGRGALLPHDEGLRGNAMITAVAEVRMHDGLGASEFVGVMGSNHRVNLGGRAVLL